MKMRYIAFDTLIMEPVVLNVLATSGMAESTVVDETGARKPQTARMQVISILRGGEIRSYMESSILGTGAVYMGMSCET